MTVKSTRKAALFYASRGWPIIPIWPIENGRCRCGRADCERQGKHPVENWAPNGFKDATVDQELINRWWNHMPNANIATAKWFRIDVDTKAGGLDAWRELLYKNDPMPPTCVCKTPSGGLHYYFRSTETHGNRNGTGDLPDDIDVRGNFCGYTLLPPSNHIQGIYSWGEHHPKTTEIPPAPDWLYELVGPDGANGDDVEFADPLPRPDLSAWDFSGLLMGIITSDRSRIDQAAITSMVYKGLTNDEIRAIYQNYAIGKEGKYGGKGTGADKYLALSIGKARAWVKEHQRPERRSEL